MCLCMSFVHVLVSMEARSIRTLDARIIRSCGPPEVGVGKQTLVLCKSHLSGPSYFKIRSQYAALASLQLLNLSDLPASASQISRTMCKHI